MKRPPRFQRRLGALLAGLALGLCSLLLLGAGCNDRVVSPGNDGRNVTLMEGEDALLATGERLRFDQVETDSRCPLGVECVWEGEAQATFSLRASGTVARTFTLPLRGALVAADTLQSMQSFQPVTVGRYRMTLLQLDPYPKAGRDPLKVPSTAIVRVEY